MEWLIIVGIVLVGAAIFLLRSPGKQDIYEAAEDREARYESNLPWFLAWWRGVGTKSRLTLLEKIQTETETHAKLLTRDGKIERIKIQNEHETENLHHQHQLTKATVENTLAVTNEATNLKISPVTLDQQKLVEHQTNEIIRLEREKAELEIKKHKETKSVDMEVYKFEKELDIKGAIIARVAPMYEVELLTQQLTKALLDRDNWLAMPDSQTKTKMLARLNKNIKLLNEAIDAKGKGLTQGTNRRELGPVEED